jgi:hypothetical protein
LIRQEEPEECSLTISSNPKQLAISESVCHPFNILRNLRHLTSGITDRPWAGYGAK